MLSFSDFNVLTNWNVGHGYHATICKDIQQTVKTISSEEILKVVQECGIQTMLLQEVDFIHIHDANIIFIYLTLPSVWLFNNHFGVKFLSNFNEKSLPNWDPDVTLSSCRVFLTWKKIKYVLTHWSQRKWLVNLTTPYLIYQKAFTWHDIDPGPMAQRHWHFCQG